MNLRGAVGGGLFPREFLERQAPRLPEFEGARKELEAGLEDGLRRIREDFPSEAGPSEADTENEFIWKVLELLGWTSSLRQQNLSLRGRRDVPDGILFADADTKQDALGQAREPDRYRFAVCLVESKRWSAGLDQAAGSGRAAPAAQLLRYLRTAWVQTGGNLRFGILTNGAKWRLYDAMSASVSGQFLEVDLERALTPGTGLHALSDDERSAVAALFLLFFRRDAFRPGADVERDSAAPDGTGTFHERALGESRYFAARIAADLSEVVHGAVFEELVRRLGEAAPDEEPGTVRDAALVWLYRLLFLAYAEDRELLPVSTEAYARISLRRRVRDELERQRELQLEFSRRATTFWTAIEQLVRLVADGDSAFGLPPYDGALFARERAPLLNRVALSDALIVDLVDRVSYRADKEGRRYLNYGDLSVRQLGAIYERLLQLEVVRNGGALEVRYNVEARKDSGSYYTPDSLVQLIVEEAVGPAVEDALERFRANPCPENDPAERILALKVCDPAMGSGHFLVSLVDYLTDRVLEALADADAEGVPSPVADRIRAMREALRQNAAAGGWRVFDTQLDDRNLVRRLVLKRCVYGVDKNPLAVELAKLSLWLHSFTVGAPLGFLSHHLRSGDSLFGSRVADAVEAANNGNLFLQEPLRRAQEAARPMADIEALADTELAEAERSRELFGRVEGATGPLNRFLSVLTGTYWSESSPKAAAAARRQWLSGHLGDPVALAAGELQPPPDRPLAGETAKLLAEARECADGERFLAWEAAFPGVWPDLGDARRGGFDAVIGNPPWDRVKLQQVEWFALRAPEIAAKQRAAERKRAIGALRKAGDPLAGEFDRAERRARTAAQAARESGHYPLLGRGDLNLYSLFVERAMSLIRPGGTVGLLVPSGIASDRTAAEFFRTVSTGGRLRALYDFENGRRGSGGGAFFPAVHRSFKFSAFVAARDPIAKPARCGFFLHDVADVLAPDRCFDMRPADFRRVNPNTGTAPIFRRRRDQRITTAIYGRLPVLVDRSSGKARSAWPVGYRRMFDMTNDSGRFYTRQRLQNEEGAWPIAGNRFENAEGKFVPLYEGKMVQAFDHRAASIRVDLTNVHRPAQPDPASESQHGDPAWCPTPQYWVREADCGWEPTRSWVVGFKEVTAPTNERSVISAVVPAVGFGNTLPLLVGERDECREWLLAANLNSLVLDFVARQKIHGQHLNLFVMEQLPVVPPDLYASTFFGSKTAEDVIREDVLELTYTSEDMAPFARHLGHLDASGDVLPPFRWDPERRLRLRARVDAVFFHLYGITDRDEIRYIFSTFPAVEKAERKRYGAYRSRDLCLNWMNALAAGRPDADVAG